ncbi:MAG: hypothetical protein JKY52_09100 [Flavobacteriales bacterium]|nr:hypothetical protein [Flavobacteriales bacterium]
MSISKSIFWAFISMLCYVLVITCIGFGIAHFVGIDIKATDGEVGLIVTKFYLGLAFAGVFYGAFSCLDLFEHMFKACREFND